jgi:hypothetical protein
VFQASRCALSGAPLELPAVHFFCGHSFNGAHRLIFFTHAPLTVHPVDWPCCAAHHRKRSTIRSRLVCLPVAEVYTACKRVAAASAACLGSQAAPRCKQLTVSCAFPTDPQILNPEFRATPRPGARGGGLGVPAVWPGLPRHAGHPGGAAGRSDRAGAGPLGQDANVL